MTQQEFDRWKDFALRMAQHGWPDATDARKARIIEAVDLFIADMEPWKDEIGGWDGGPMYLCDEMDTFFSNVCHQYQDVMRGQTKFESQVSCCVRAGIDVAVEPSAGVVGFTVGTLRHMYDGKIPEWIAQWFEPPLTDALPDDRGVWL